MLKSKENTANYNLLIKKLDDFIRKFYKNKIIKGIILVLSIMLISFLLVNILEYFGHFGTLLRSILFYTYLFVNIFILILYIFIPVFQLFKLGKIISHKQASQIIGAHFENVNDKLTNTLQLREMLDLHPENKQIIEFSINQKIENLKPISFNTAINILENRKYLKYLIIPIVVLLIFIFGAPQVLTESTNRLIDHKIYYAKELPFKFILLNDSLATVRNEDFMVSLEVDGHSLPSKVNIEIDGSSFVMDRQRNNVFEYNIKNVRSNFEFKFSSGSYYSNSYKVIVLPKPLLRKFTIRLDYPNYLGKKTEEIINVGDLTIPTGTKVYWKFFTEETEKLLLGFEREQINLKRNAENIFSYSKRFLTNNFYSVKTSNKFMDSKDSIIYYINIIPDAYPQIQVDKKEDSLISKYMFFSGEISDDYGLSKLTFNYRYKKSEDSLKIGKKYSTKITVISGKNYQNFIYSFDLNKLSISAGDVLEYYFEVWDNDGVNGHKSTMSQRFFYEAPSMKEIDEKTDKMSSELKSGMKDAFRKTKEIQEELKEARKKLLENKTLKWEDKKYIEDVLQKQKDLKSQIDKLKEKYKENVSTTDEYKKISDEMMEKYEQLFEMFEKVIPEELKKLYEELDELLKKNMKDEIQEEMENMEMSTKDMEKELDRMLEMFKQFEFEQKTDELIEKLDELAEKQEELADKTDEKKSNQEDLEKKQNRLNEDFKDIEQDFKELEKLNKELENSHNLDDFKPEQKDIEQQQSESLKNLQNNKKKKSSQNQRNAAKKMKDLSKKMAAMNMKMKMSAMKINYKKLRQIVENLIHLSFEQEKLIEELKKINTYNPQYVELAQRQRKLNDEAKMIEDSLFALSKRVPQIKNYINRELNNLNFNMDKTIGYFADRNIPEVRKNQQYVMTSVNNIAVMLSEVLKSMQSQMSMKGSGTKMCNNPKKGKSPKSGIKGLRKLQEQLNQQIKDLKNGQKPGQGGMSKRIAQMAAKQEKLRNQLRQIEMENKKNGNDPGAKLNEIQELMEETEKDLVNKRINAETIRRQKQITIKLLEAEKAEKEQGREKKRKSRTAADIFKRNPPSLEEYNKEKLKEIELLRTVPPTLNPYYRIKVKEYFRQLPVR